MRRDINARVSLTQCLEGLYLSKLMVLRKATMLRNTSALQSWSRNVVAGYFINNSAFSSLLSAGSVFRPAHLVTTMQTRNDVKNAHPIVKPVLEAKMTSA